MKKMLFSLLLVTGSYAAMAQSEVKLLEESLEEGPIIRLYGLPAVRDAKLGRISCGRQDGICAEIQTKTVGLNNSPVFLKIYIGGEIPLEMEAKKVSIQELNNRQIIKIEE